MQNYRDKHIIIKEKMVGATRQMFSILGRFEPIGRENTDVRQTYTLHVKGDKPSQRRCVYKIPRPELETAKNVIYTPQGIAINQGRIVERFSIRKPSLLELIRLPRLKPLSKVPTATIMQSETPYTYGDWVGDFLHSIVTAEKIIEPILLPKYLANKNYVKRDLDFLKISYIACNIPTEISTTHILRKKIPSYYWNSDDVSAFRKKFSLNPPSPNKGSIIYLARFDNVGEAVYRQYPSSEIADFVKSLGGQVCDTRYASPEDYDRIAISAETIIADQGSALFNVVRWNAKNIIELTNSDWWHNSSLFVANSCGIKNYTVICIDKSSIESVKSRIYDEVCNTIKKP